MHKYAVLEPKTALWAAKLGGRYVAHVANPPPFQQHNMIRAFYSLNLVGAHTCTNCCIRFCYRFLLGLLAETQEYSGICSAGTGNKPVFCEAWSPPCGSHCQPPTWGQPMRVRASYDPKLTGHYTGIPYAIGTYVFILNPGFYCGNTREDY